MAGTGCGRKEQCRKKPHAFLGGHPPLETPPRAQWAGNVGCGEVLPGDAWEWGGHAGGRSDVAPF